uniref:Uncharacterized protein n=1 Tax=Coturnix japonica TaxID=93934 RepID=A0A8C2UC88_COTJA
DMARGTRRAAGPPAGGRVTMSHNIPAAALQVAHQKPLPSLEKLMLPKRIDIIQQPRKC